MAEPEKRSWLDAGLDKAKRALEVGSEAADVLVHLQGGVRPLGVAAVGLRVINSVRQHRAQDPEQYFGTAWVKLDLGPLLNNVYQSLVADPGAALQEVPGVYEDTPAVIFELDALRLGFALTGHTKRHGVEPRGCWVPVDQDRDDSVRRVGRSLWETLKSSSAVVSPQKKGSMKLVPPRSSKVLQSSLADELYARMKEFLDGGYNRSVFVLGEPGVGKSELLKYVASLHGGFQLRLKLSDLGSISGTDLTRIVEVLRPDSLVVDDFDRFVMGKGSWNAEDKASKKAAEMLDPIEQINSIVPLFMVSANFSEQITEAMLRPGRFDEPVTITELDPEIYKRLLPDAPAKVIKELKRVKAPVAYVQELRKRVEVLGYKKAATEMKDLMRRSRRAIDLNKRKTSKRSSRGGPSLVGKSPRQKAGILERRAAQGERRAGKLIDKADQARVIAEKLRVKAEEEREKAKEHDAQVKAKASKKAKK